MSEIIHHFVSGQAIFSGTVGCLVGAILVRRRGSRMSSGIGRIFILFGIGLIVLSSTPLPLAASIFWAASFVAWVATCRSSSLAYHEIKTFIWFLATSLAVVAWEMSYQFPAAPAWEHREKIIVVGDSLSAEDFAETTSETPIGKLAPDPPWPRLLENQHAIPIVNLAFSGAVTESAVKKTATADFSHALVIVEIGGNDLFKGVATADFERGLDRLLSQIHRDDNSIMMLELPLPPFYNGFGAVQRRLAQKYHVTLAPKRLLARVLADSSQTIDGVHLSPTGHQALADAVWNWMAFDEIRTPSRDTH